jgi:hypothetical protein
MTVVKAVAPAAVGPAVFAPTTPAPAPTPTVSVKRSTNWHTYLQTYDIDTILWLLIFVFFYALVSTVLLCYYFMRFKCNDKMKMTSPVPSTPVPFTPVPSTLVPSSTVVSPSESCFSECPSFSSTYGPSFSNDSEMFESYV